MIIYGHASTLNDGTFHPRYMDGCSSALIWPRCGLEGEWVKEHHMVGHGKWCQFPTVCSVLPTNTSLYGKQWQHTHTHTHTNIGSFVCRRSIEHWTELIGTDASKHHSSPVMAMHDHSLSRLLFFFNFFLIFAPLSNISFTHWLWPIYLFDDYTLSCLDIGAHAHIYPNSSCLELIDCYNRLDSPYNVHSYLISLCRLTSIELYDVGLQFLNLEGGEGKKRRRRVIEDGHLNITELRSTVISHYPNQNVRV